MEAWLGHPRERRIYHPHGGPLTPSGRILILIHRKPPSAPFFHPIFLILLFEHIHDHYTTSDFFLKFVFPVLHSEWLTFQYCHCHCRCLKLTHFFSLSHSAVPAGFNPNTLPASFIPRSHVPPPLSSPHPAYGTEATDLLSALFDAITPPTAFLPPPAKTFGQ